MLHQFFSAAAVLAVGAALTTGAALAADLENHDDTDYDIKIRDGATTHTSIEGNTTRTSVCSSCTIEVVGVGEVEVDSSTDAVIIEDGAVYTE